MTRRWDQHFLRMAQEQCRMSDDPATQVGAVIVGEGGAILAVGFNAFPQGIEVRTSRLQNRDTKLRLMVHAEMHALMAAARNGVSVRDATLYLAATDETGLVWGGPPCCRCTVHVIQAGIRRVVSRPGKPPDVAWKWREDTEQARALLEEACVSFHEVEL